MSETPETEEHPEDPNPLEKLTSTNKKSFQNKNVPSKTETSKYHLSKTDLLFYVLIFITFIGTIIFISKSKTFVESLRQKNPTYFFPTMQYITIWSIILTIILIIPKVLFENILTKYNEWFLDPKYNTPKYLPQKEKVRRKVSIYFIKFLHYLVLTILSYIILDQMEWFPKELFGHGDIKYMYHKGLTSFSFFERPYGFDIHYLINLAYTYADLICVLFIYDGQTDFLTMIFHHFCTISLILFSYYDHYSSFGSIILFLHNATDIFVYLSRTLLYHDLNKILKIVMSFLLSSSFMYARIYVLAKVIYSLATQPTWESYGVNEGFVTLLTCLYVLQSFWAYKLILIGYKGIMKGSYSDSRDFIPEKKEENKKIQ